MKKYNKDIGNYGEDLASSYLINKGYKIVDRNFSNRFGEIDIICSKEDILIFVEVKSRYNKTFGSGIDSISYSKVKNIKKLTKYFLLNNKFNDYFIRFDVIEVYLNYNNSSNKIIHTKDAFR
ncbi:YraN family protein [Clostridium baratii]|uniref:YraN family protein n=1 Tax=Clostridium baratii TaxID=1561 RepID=UPI00097FB2C2|nr:YraN family protein [Clostridium baratii]AQM59295.1 YraN family protein [Clostridium baratii]